MTPYVSNAGAYLVQTLFGIYVIAVLLRFLLQYFRADMYYNPLARMVVQLTNPALKRLRRYIPGLKGIDWAALLLALAVEMIAVLLIFWLSGRMPSPLGVLVVALAELCKFTLYIFGFAIIVQVVLSWIATDRYNPASEVMDSLAEPILRPLRQLIPPLGGMDFSPIAALILLRLTQMLLIDPLRDFGLMLTR